MISMLGIVGFMAVLASRRGLQFFYLSLSARIRRRDVPAPGSGRVYGLPAKPLLEIHDAV